MVCPQTEFALMKLFDLVFGGCLSFVLVWFSGTVWLFAKVCLCFELCVRFWLNVGSEGVDKKEKSPGDGNLSPSLPSSFSQQIPAGDAIRCSNMNNTQILGCPRSFFFSSHQFAYSK